ncbi:MAG TPA: DUF58 domain-containing protein [Gemmatimonadaceae bacterium]|nr:DUF58 domain-containing protein [Gemmatimonadaceae bacterium]
MGVAQGTARHPWLALVRVVPTRRLAAVIAVAAPIWAFSGSPEGVLVAVAVALLIGASAIVDVLAAPFAGELVVERTFADAVGIGEENAGVYTLHSARRSRMVVTLHDALPDALERVTDAAAPLRLPGYGTAEIPFAARGSVRGVVPLGPVAVRVAGPLGLMQRTLRYDFDDTVAIVPSVEGLRRYRLLAMQQRIVDAGVRVTRHRGDSTNFAGLRDYVMGDDPRHIAWKVSARRDKLTTREFTVEQGQTVILAIDAGRMMTQLSNGTSRFEMALSAASILADVAVRSGDRVGLIVFDDAVRAFVPPARGGEALRVLRDALVPVNATMVEPDYALALRTLASRYRRRSLIVLFTDVIDPRASRVVIAHTAASRSRHLPLVVAMQNPQLMAAAVPRIEEDPAALYRHAAAEELVQARQEALLQMRRAGVEVIDTPPQAMTPALVNRYLEIKARGVL